MNEPASLNERASRLLRVLPGRELGWAVCLLVLCVSLFALERNWQGRMDKADARDNALLIGSERLLSSLKDLETGQRGYLLTGDDAYLQPYTDALPRLRTELTALMALHAPLDGLVEVIDARIASASAGVEARRTQGLQGGASAVSNGRGKQLMDTARDKVAALQGDAARRMDKRAALGVTKMAWLDTVAMLLLVGSIVLVALYARRRRQESRAAASLLSSVLENAPIGLGLLDHGLRVVHMNRCLAELATAGSGTGQSLWTVMPVLQEQFAPRLQRVVAQRQSIAATDVTVQDPDRPDQPRFLQVGFFPLGSGDTRAGGAGMVVVDVTARNRLEQRVRESEERFRTLVENSADIIWTTSAAGSFDTKQRQWMSFTGQDASQAAGHGWLAAIHPDDREHTGQAWSRALQEQAPYAVEHRVRRADGEWRYMAGRGVPVLEDGIVREWVGMHADVTERRLAEQALADAKDAAEAANRAKSAFLANMSHELRTPLSAVIGYSEMLEEEMMELSEPHLVSDLKKIQSNARHLLSLINDVLDLSKIEANRMTSYAEDFDVATVAREAAGTVDALVQRKRNTLRLDLADGLGTIHSDVVKLRQCLFNLISNAAKFTENGSITLAVQRDGDWVQFRVTDTGIGMTKEQLGRLFQRFSQADESTTRNFGGTGLGLALTQAFSRLLGGEITVESEPGVGTSFTLRIPALMPEQPQMEEAAAEAEPASNARNVVLVIDDDPSQRELLTRFLQREGFEVRTAADGRAGLEIAAAVKPRAILLDVMMPQMDGWSVLTALKADPALAPIPVIMASFVNEPALANSMGAADYLLKPLEWDQLKTVMQRFRAGEGRVLVVDDDAEARARLRIVLERNNWTVAEAGNGEEALTSIQEAVPVVILLDLTMPVMDGFTFLHELRTRMGDIDVPVVVLSARDLSQAERHSLSSASRVLRKGDVNLQDLPRQLAGLRDG